jgi:hypothetical protein
MIDIKKTSLSSLSVPRIKINYNSNLTYINSETYSYKMVYFNSALSQNSSKWIIWNLWDNIALSTANACTNTKYVTVKSIYGNRCLR